jgi:hypothetical protein
MERAYQRTSGGVKGKNTAFFAKEVKNNALGGVATCTAEAH